MIKDDNFLQILLELQFIFVILKNWNKITSYLSKVKNLRLLMNTIKF